MKHPRRRSLLLLLATWTLLGLGACSSPHYVRPQGAAVIILDDHHHSRYCGHYLFGHQWYFIERHVHGVDCDHELIDGRWTLVGELPPQAVAAPEVAAPRQP